MTGQTSSERHATALASSGAGHTDTITPQLTLPLSEAPCSCDVLVIGAGPAGSACAIQLAKSGFKVVLVDKRLFPRDKICGDGLVPDALAALNRLGLLDEVKRHARAAGIANCVAPSQSELNIPGEMLMLPRRTLDDILCRAAIGHGATFVAPAQFDHPLLDEDGRVCGARLSAPGIQHDIRAPWVVLATGAATGPLSAARACLRDTPSGFALRQYVRHDTLAGEMKGLRFVWHRELRGGYGWVFPGPDGVCNVGFGTFHKADPQARAHNDSLRLKEMYRRFVQIDPVAARLLGEGEVLSPLKGAPFRCDLEGARWYRPGLLVTGEAAGSTYSLTGEGIGKAMECGMAAAASLSPTSPAVAGGQLEDQPARDWPDAAQDERVGAIYTAHLQALVPRFQMYRRAASFNRYPWLVNLIVWQARRRPALMAALSDILEERRLPDRLLSLRGLRLLWRTR